MATFSRLAQPRYTPSPEEIEAAVAPMRQKRIDKANRELDSEPRRERERLRVARYRMLKRVALTGDIAVPAEKEECIDDCMMSQARYEFAGRPDDTAAELYAVRAQRVPTPLELEVEREFEICEALDVLHAIEGEPEEMSHEDIANVELISDDELADAMGPLLDCVGLQSRLSDLTGRWTLAGDPTTAKPLKSKQAASVPFRSAL